jgi:hypothetical protein
VCWTRWRRAHRALPHPGLGDGPAVDHVEQGVEEQHEAGAPGVDHPASASTGSWSGVVLQRLGRRRPGRSATVDQRRRRRPSTAPRRPRPSPHHGEDRALDRPHHRLVGGVGGGPQRPGQRRARRSRPRRRPRRRSPAGPATG